MGRNYRQIKTALPELKDEEDIKELAEKLDLQEEFAELAKSEAGQSVVNKLRQDCAYTLGVLISSYNIQDSYEKLYALVADFHAKLKVLDSFVNAEKDAQEYQNIIDDLIKERI